MDSLLDAAQGAPVVSCVVQFFVFLALGGAVGWVFSGVRLWRAWSASLAIVGVCGAWMGAEFARLFGQAQSGSQPTLVAAVIGALGLGYAWRRHHPQTSDRIALPGSGSAPR
ncbi:MAG: hypothetical protein ACR652_00955 [Methylocystis sp.]|uniref:hypothetical protein n=1 Tax=Methylocystis sp. TaxID=1911079 RepID=UPI003DA604C8